MDIKWLLVKAGRFMFMYELLLIDDLLGVKSCLYIFLGELRLLHGSYRVDNLLFKDL